MRLRFPFVGGARRKPEPMHWQCAHCHDWRDDKNISAREVVREVSPRNAIQLVIRYCNDREACIAAATALPTPEQWRRR